MGFLVCYRRIFQFNDLTLLDKTFLDKYSPGVLWPDAFNTYYVFENQYVTVHVRECIQGTQRTTYDVNVFHKLPYNVLYLSPNAPNYSFLSASKRELEDIVNTEIHTLKYANLI